MQVREPKTLDDAYKFASKFEECYQKTKNSDGQKFKSNYIKTILVHTRIKLETMISKRINLEIREKQIKVFVLIVKRQDIMLPSAETRY